MQSSLGVAYDVTRQSIEVGPHRFDLFVLRDFEATVDVIWEHICRRPDADAFFEQYVPMFGWLWPVSRVLCEVVVEHVKPGDTVLELGCGLALPSMVAARLGARVLATDMHPDTPLFLAQNVRNNALEGLDFECFDWRQPPTTRIPVGGFDWLLASDVLYDQQLVGLLAATIDQLLSRDGTAWVADPGRPWLEAFDEACRGRGLVVDVDVRDAGDVEAFVLRVTRLPSK